MRVIGLGPLGGDEETFTGWSSRGDDATVLAAITSDPAQIEFVGPPLSSEVRTLLHGTGRAVDLNASTMSVRLSGMLAPQPVVPRSGPRPPGVRRAAWAAARRLDTLKRRRRRRAGLPALRPPGWHEVFVPAARVRVAGGGVHWTVEGR